MWAIDPTIPFYFASRFWLEALLCLVGLGIVLRVVCRGDRLRLQTDDLPAVLLVCAALYGVLLAAVQHEYLTCALGCYFSLTPVAVYFAVRWERPTGRDLRAFALVALVSYLLLAGASLAVYFLNPPFMMRVYSVSRLAFFHGSDADIYRQLTTQYFRMQSLLLDENEWGELCSCIALVAIARATGRRVRVPERALLIAVIVMALACLGLSMSRGAIVGFVGGMFVLGAIHRSGRRNVALTVLVLACAAAVAVIVLRSDPRAQQLQTRFVQPAQMQSIDEGRQWQWKIGLECFEGVPSGLGLGGAGYAQHAAATGAEIAMDGIYLRVLVEQGVPGFALWIFGTAGMGVILLRRTRLLERRRSASGAMESERFLLQSLGAGLVASLASLCIHGGTANTFDYYEVPVLFFMFTALFLARSDEHLLPVRPQEIRVDPA
jgi:hypothetical protein